ncbi:MAG: trimethylamine methyltransferase family protein [Clostridiales Family XIII bacterium]|jgi:trimethylamine--corrinoid protein Co-methyltransferase|nr:trimethylamine methyltransferase family protein [Clostridiales Family XIII bacterium]
MRLQLEILTKEERVQIHGEALRILEEVGARYPSEEALALLAGGGAVVDWDTQVARLPRGLVESALALCPREVRFGARDPAWDFALPSGMPLYNLDGCGVFTYDYGTGLRRSAVLRDVSDAARVFDSLAMGWLAWPPVSPGDVPIAPRSIVSTATVMKNCSKHVMDEVKTRAEVPYAMALSGILAGGTEQARERPMYSATYCTVSPLCHDPAMMEATMDLSAYYAPILVYPTPASGTTGPASLYGNVALAVAEALSCVALFQLRSPGCPLVMGAAMGSVDGRTGAFLYGAPETALQLAAVAEMCAFYGMPSFVAGCTADAKMPGIQSAIEKMVTSLPAVLAGAGMLNGFGLLECGMTLSLEQMVIDGEIALLNERLRRGIDLAPEKNLFDDVQAVGPGGHFLKRKSTRALFRSDEFQEAPLLDRGGYAEWRADGGRELTDKAHARVRDVLAAEQRLPMDTETARLLDEVVAEAKAKL